MAKILKGKEVVGEIILKLRNDISELKIAGLVPKLALVRIGQRASDAIFEGIIEKLCAEASVAVEKHSLSFDVEESRFEALINTLNEDQSIHGIYMFQDVPKFADPCKMRNLILPAKDVGGVTDVSLNGGCAKGGEGFPHCFAEACQHILEHYKIEIAGAKVVIAGSGASSCRSVATLLKNQNADVTVCDMETPNLPDICKPADILVVNTGRSKSISGPCFSFEQAVLDMGFNANSAGIIYGDVNFQMASFMVKAVTPVPGGVGYVAMAVLVKHMVEAGKTAMMNDCKCKDLEYEECLKYL